MACVKTPSPYPSKPALVAEEFLKNSQTFAFDGMEETLQLTGVTSDQGWTFTFEFKCAHGGYGDRTGKPVIQAITPHTAVITVDNLEITSAIIDGKWNMIRQEEVATLEPDYRSIWTPYMSTALASVDDEGNQQRFSYTVSLCNEGSGRLYVNWIEPVLSAELSSTVVTEDLKVTVDQNIEAGACISVKGEFILNTEGMTKLEILDLEPFMTGMKLNGEIVLELPGLKQGGTDEEEETSSLPQYLPAPL